MLMIRRTDVCWQNQTRPADIAQTTTRRAMYNCISEWRPVIDVDIEVNCEKTEKFVDDGKFICVRSDSLRHDVLLACTSVVIAKLNYYNAYKTERLAG